MLQRTRLRRVVIAVCCLVGLAAGEVRAAALETEHAPVFRASSFLPRSVISGPNHRVDDMVRNDGYMNIYIVHSPKGDLRVESTALLYTRVYELEAAAAMDKVNTGGVFAKSVAASGANAVKGAVNLVIHPIDSVSGAVSGVGKAFSRANASMNDRRPPDEAGAGAGLIGYNQAKRDYAKQYGVDPYSRNAILQTSLKRLASAGTAGGLTGTVAKVAIPGGVGLAVSAASGSHALNEIDVSTPPEDLFARNRTRMEAMGVTTDVAYLFNENPHFTPTSQTRLVVSLDKMSNVRDRGAFINFCVLTDNDDVALFRERMATLYANLNATTDRLDRFVPVGKLIAARTAAGGFLVAYPLDYLAWTPTVASLARSLNAAATAEKSSTKKLVVAGEVSPLAQATLRKAGWTVVSLREGLAQSKSPHK